MSLQRDSDELIFYVNGRKIVEKHADPEVMLLPYLRKTLFLTGTKYGCGVGGCGACTVMVSTIHPVSKKILHHPATACLLPICSLYGMAVTTTEGIGNSARLHPVQERIAKAHGSQCGFCTPGMVMSMYSLLRNHPDPTMEQISEALSGNLCRCTGYRPILDGCRTFAKDCCLNNTSENMLPESQRTPKLFNKEDFLPLDKTQEIIFPPELMLMLDGQKKMSVFKGERITWYSPGTMAELLDLKNTFPKAPLVVGNTAVGLEMKFEGVFHPVIISPVRIPELFAVSSSNQGITIGAACTLAQMKTLLSEAVSNLPEEKTETFCALIKQLSTLAGEQIRNMASIGGHVVNKGATSDLNPVLAAGNAVLNVASKGGARQIPINDKYFVGAGASALKSEEIVLSVFIPHTQKGEFVSAFRQAQREENAFAIVNAGMRVLFNEGTDVIKDMSIFYGGIGSTTLPAKNLSQALVGRAWDDKMLSEACKLVLDEVTLPPSAPGAKVEFRRTLVISFFFKFYLENLEKMKKPIVSSVGGSEFLSAIRDFENEMPKTLQIFQGVDPKQPCDDPIGRPVVHLSGIKQATGEAVYVDDMPPVSRELFIAFVTSERAHAKVLSIDSSQALTVPGFVDVVGAEDVPAVNEVDGQGALFSNKTVYCVGQIVCAVVADTPDHARRAAAKVKVNYENLEPVILTMEDAIKYKSFFQPNKSIHHGNAQEAFKTAHQIIEGEIHIAGQEQFYMETNSVLIVPKGEENEMDIYVSTQDPTTAQLQVAKVLGVPSNRIVSHVKRVGGAFGGKMTKPAIFTCATAVAAYKTKRPVRCILERGEDMLITAGRHPFLANYKVGFMNDGQIVAADVNFFTNAGCTPDESILVLMVALIKMDSAYNYPNLTCTVTACKTNLPSNTAFRGFGFPQTGLVTETIMDDVARRSGIAPNKVREKNFYKGISRTHYKQEFDADNLLRCWNECIQKSSFHERKAEIQEFNKKNYWKKKGLAIIPLKFSVGFVEKIFHQAAALVHIYRDGKVFVAHGGVELGQGLFTKITQIASRELKIPMSYIHNPENSTLTIPNSIPSAAALSTDMYGLAVKRACETLYDRLKPFMKQNPNGGWEQWVLGAFAERVSLSATGFYRGYDTYMDWEKSEGHPGPYYIYGAGCSEIELDCLTGGHKNLRTDIVVDAGKSINPGIDMGQVEGAFTQGLGLYTIEELQYSPQGTLYTRGPDKYKIPAICDVPTEFNVSFLANSENPFAIYSSRGLGETAVFLGCTVFFALKDAVDAAREERGLPKEYPFNSPAGPERLRMACADHLTKMIPRDNPGLFVPWSVDVSR
ncbi:aldehyde oxidase 1-like [Discoglossus pictus]